MGIAIPQVVTSDRATGAQVIGGSVGFTSESQTHLTRTPSSEGNRKTFTYSCWVKRDSLGDNPVNNKRLFSARDTDAASNSYSSIYFRGTGLTGQLEFLDYLSGTREGRNRTEGRPCRDTSGWYHICVAVDYTDSTAKDRIKIYINGVRQGRDSANDIDPDTTDQTFINSTEEHNIGKQPGDTDKTQSGRLSQVYLIDGQALGPEYFGFTDPLTNTWKPKKYVNTTASHGDAAGVVGFGTNGFYLPFDGNSPIGQDQSGQGNDYTPVNFGGSVALDNPQVSGARPILNTTQGGTQAGVGVFGSKQNVGYAVTVYDDGGGNKYYIDGVKQATLTGLIRGATYTFDTSDSTVSSHPFRFSDSDGGSEYPHGVAAITGTATTITIPHNAPNQLYYYCTSHSGMGSSITGITTNASLADPYAWKCILAVPGAGGSYEDVSPSIACTSAKKSASAGGDPSSDSSSNFYGSSIDLDGNDKVTYTRTNAGDFSAQNDFTIEAWFNTDTTSATDAGLFSNWDSGNNRSILFGPNASGNGDFTFIFNTTGSGSWTTVANPDAIAGKWMHVAWVYDHSATRHYAYINGVLQGSATGTAYNNSTANFLLGVNKGDASGYYNGKVQDLRYYHAVKYTASGTTAGEVVFTLPSTSPDILPDTPSGVSGSSKLTKITDGAVSFDGTGDYLNTAWSSDFAFGTGDFTIEMFVYWQGDTSTSTVLAWGEDIDNRFDIGCQTANQIRVFARTGGSTFVNMDVANGISTNKWIHLAVVRNSSAQTMKLYIDGVEKASTSSVTATMPTNTSNGIDIGRRRYASSTSDNYQGFISNLRIIKGTALYTSNFTPPAAPLTNVTNTKLLCCQSNTSATASVVVPISSGTGYTGNTSAITVTSASLNAGSDTNTVDGDTSTSADIRGAGSFVQLVFPQQQNGTLQVNVANGNDVNDDDIRVFIDGVEGTSFDVSSQQWYTIHTGNFTTVKLEHQGSTTGYIYGFRIGTSGDTIINASGGVTANGDAAATNFNPFNTDINTVRGQETGYPTLNPLDKLSNVTLSNGNLTCTSGSNVEGVRSTIPFPRTGMWYVEYHMDTVTTGGYPVTGIANASKSLNEYASAGTASVRPVGSGRNLGWVINTSDTPSGYMWTGFALSAGGDTMQIAFNADKGAYYMGVNNVWWGLSGSNAIRVSTTDMLNGTNSAYDVSGDDYFAWAVPYEGKCTLNYGQKPFKFPPPDGFQPLNAANVRPETVISRPDQYVGIVTYTGNGTTGQSITGLNFDSVPDLVYIKERNATGSPLMFDTVRGAPLALQTRADTAEYNIAETLTSFNRNGFSVDYDGSSTSIVVNRTNNYVAWCWKAGGAPTATNNNTSGAMDANSVSVDGVLQSAYTPSGSPTIYPTGMSVGIKQGFSIIRYQANSTGGATIPHGLSQAPTFVLVKSLEIAGSSNSDWTVFHSTLGGTKAMYFNEQDGSGSTGSWNNTDPNTNVITLGTAHVSNLSPNHYIAYAWHDVPGLQKFGSYGGADAFVELGFRPAVLIIKSESGSRNWIIIDGVRDTFNPSDRALLVNGGDTEDDNSVYAIDFLSNGFKIRGSNGQIDGDSSYIYAAWAEAPSIDLYGGGANAR